MSNLANIHRRISYIDEQMSDLRVQIEAKLLSDPKRSPLLSHWQDQINYLYLERIKLMKEEELQRSEAKQQDMATASYGYYDYPKSRNELPSTAFGSELGILSEPIKGLKEGEALTVRHNLDGSIDVTPYEAPLDPVSLYFDEKGAKKRAYHDIVYDESVWMDETKGLRKAREDAAKPAVLTKPAWSLVDTEKGITVHTRRFSKGNGREMVDKYETTVYPESSPMTVLVTEGYDSLLEAERGHEDYLIRAEYRLFDKFHPKKQSWWVEITEDTT